MSRLTGSSKDYVVIGSDSGKISILEFNNETNVFEVRHCETFGKTGCRFGKCTYFNLWNFEFVYLKENYSWPIFGC